MQHLKSVAPPEQITRSLDVIPDSVMLAVQTSRTTATAQVEVSHVTPTAPPADIPAQLPAASNPASANLSAPLYKPTRRDYDYLAAVQTLLSKDGRVTDSAIAEELKVDRSRPAQMRKKPGFREWLKAELSSRTDDKWPLMLERAAELAMRGSIDHLNFVAKVRGEFKDGQLQPGVSSGLHVHLHV